MEKINVRFSETQRLKLDDLSSVLGMNSSDIARAVMQIGIAEIMVIAATNKERALEFASLNAIKAKQ